jgi:hypothetical protein
VTAGVRGSRTHRSGRRAGTNDFEDREVHRDPSTPMHSQDYLVIHELIEIYKLQDPLMLFKTLSNLSFMVFFGSAPTN